MKLRGSGLEVILPKGVPAEYASVFVSQNMNWVEKAISRMATQIDYKNTQQFFPPVIELRSIGLNFDLHVRYVNRAPSLAVNGHQLQLSGREGQDDTLASPLMAWLRGLGHHYLVPWCRKIADSHHVSLQAVRIATPKRRWGSCSCKGIVMLNARLLFLPPRLCEAVIYHELAHISQLNHSEKFWNHLQKLCPDALQRESELKDAFSYLPGWADMS